MTFEAIDVDELVWRDLIDRAPDGTAVGPELVVTTSYERHPWAAS